MTALTGARRRALAGVAAALVLTGCTGETEQPAPLPSPSESSVPSAPSTGDTATIDAAPVPMKVRVTRLHGRMRKGAQQALENKVARTLSTYFDDAFLGGGYPRRDFDGAFGTFTRGAAEDARRDTELLTHADLGPRTESVTPRQKAAWLSVLAPNRVAAGVTARFRLVYEAALEDDTERRVTVQGRLLLTREVSGDWQIFGYDVRRNVAPTNKGDDE